MKKHAFTLNDYRRQLYGHCYPSIGQRMLLLLQWLVSFMPGLATLRDVSQRKLVEGEFRRMWGIIDSMTPAERMAPKLIDKSRRARIARGAGVSPGDVGLLIRQFHAVAQMMAIMRQQHDRSWRHLRTGELSGPEDD